MGEAKRRKALGLMPTVHAFEAELDASGTVTLVRGPDEDRLRRLIVEVLGNTQSRGAAWDSEYRSSLVLTRGHAGRLETAADLEAIPVAPLRRITGELALGKDPAQAQGVALPVEGGVVRLREQRHSFDGERWETFAPLRDPQRLMTILQSHPAFTLEGEVIGQFRAEHWQAGRMDLDPEPPEDILETLEAVAREWHGETPELWAELHADRLEDDAAPPPLARRTTFELRRPAPLQSPLSRVFAVRGDVEFFPLMDDELYSPDGETWIAYADPEAEVEEDGLPAELARIFDLETVAVTVHADGRIEWDHDDIPAEHAERVREGLREATGAGDADAWADWTAQVLAETFGAELAVPEDAELPVPLAVRLDLPEDALADPDPLSQTFMESEVTFDGQTWRDLFGEELPPELSAFAASDAGTN